MPGYWRERCPFGLARPLDGVYCRFVALDDLTPEEASDTFCALAETLYAVHGLDADALRQLVDVVVPS